MNEDKKQQIKLAITDLSNLPIGWDYGTDGPVSHRIIHKALSVIDFIYPLIDNVEVMPFNYGGINLIFANILDEYFVDIRINPDMTIDVVLEKGIGINYSTILYESNSSIEYAKELIENYIY